MCIASVADQKVEVEHIVQDAASDDGTLEWLLKDKRAKTFVEKDEGMYDAINRGLKKSSGEICAHLNCDEQYLPGTLTAVGKFFVNHPEVEILFGDALVVDSTGGFLCHRKSILPQKPHTLVSRNLSTLTCSTFFRRSVFEKHALFFDPAWRILGDAEWLLRCIEQKIPMALLNAFTSVFTNTGDNMSLRPGAQREGESFVAGAPTWWRAAKSLIIAQHRLRKLVKGVY
ncbi:MAG: glycosyltransferase, partial [Verrucomicrobiota bacterium]